MLPKKYKDNDYKNLVDELNNEEEENENKNIKREVQVLEYRNNQLNKRPK